MALGSLGQRSARGVALLAGLAGTGCRSLPVHRLQPAIAEQAAGATAPADPARPLPALPPLRPVSDAEALAPNPTPLLDASLAHARHEAALMADPTAATNPAPPAPAREPAPVGGPSPSPEPGAAETAGEEGDGPADVWDAGIDRLRGLAREQARQGGEIGRVWDLRERLLSGMAGYPIAGGPPSSWDTVLAALAEASSSAEPSEPEPDPEPAPAPAPGPPAVEAEPPLEITDLQLCRKVHSYGDYEPIAPDTLKPGQKVILYCEVAGLRAVPESDRFRSRLSSTVEIWADGAEAPVWTRSLGSAGDTCRHRRRDYFVNYRLALPETLRPGPYRLRLTQTDEVAGRSAMRELSFSTRAAKQ